MPKNEHVPETKTVKPNREQRRHPEKFARPENEPVARDDQAVDPNAPDQPAKTGGRPKHTADKWNQ